jgi:predicted ATP-grasp superfamily ATP-dependent carboligase
VGSTNCQNLVIVTTDLRITESDAATKACRYLAKYVKELAPREVLILDAIIPAKKYRDNYVTQMRVDVPPDDFWDGKSISPFQGMTDKDKYFLYLAVALKKEQIPARGILCETSGKDIDPEGAKKLLNVLVGHPAFPAKFDYQRMEALAAEIHQDLKKLTEREREKSTEENKKKMQENRDLHYIQ